MQFVWGKIFLFSFVVLNLFFTLPMEERVARLSFPVFARRRFIFLADFFFRSRDGLSWERGTARSLE